MMHELRCPPPKQSSANRHGLPERATLWCGKAGPVGPAIERKTVVDITISREEIQEKMNRGDDFVLVEALPEEAFHNAHLPGAVNLPIKSIWEEAEGVLPDKDTEIVVYCLDPE